jgi:jumonji domain-containing protein 7
MDRRADAITSGPDGHLYFAEPCTEQLTMTELLDALSDENREEVVYLQSQNGNLYTSTFFNQDGPAPDHSEFESLRSNTHPDIPWCTEAFCKHPDAVNLWIGNHRSQTSIHSDPYENLYTVVRGTKHFLLLSPTEGWCTQGELSLLLDSH